MLSISGLNLFSTKSNTPKAPIQKNPTIKLHSQPKSDAVSFGMNAKQPEVQLQILHKFVQSLGRKFKTVKLFSDRKNEGVFLSKTVYDLADIKELAELAERKINRNIGLIYNFNMEGKIPEAMERAFLLQQKSRAASECKNNFVIDYPQMINNVLVFPESMSKAKRKAFLDTEKTPLIINTNIAKSELSPDLIKKNLFNPAMQIIIDNKLLRCNGGYKMEYKDGKKLLLSKSEFPTEMYSLKLVD